MAPSIGPETTGAKGGADCLLHARFVRLRFAHDKLGTVVIEQLPGQLPSR